MTMEASQPLAVESFSDSWLSNVNSFMDVHDEPSRVSFDSLHEAIFKESSCMILKFNRYPEESQDFDFNVPIPESSCTLVHADEIFSRGVLKPVLANSSRMTTTISESNPVLIASSLSLSSDQTVNQVIRINCHFLVRWRKLSKQILKCFKHLCCEVSELRKRPKFNDIDRRALEVKSWSSSSKLTRYEGADSSIGAWCEMESSIHEAVLYCKRSIEK
ncbi:putative Membrane-associated kinase regulator-like protein [Quillaja saponaria]|uniref:Membrane-associated kinase regulator-like protein n=1 Tax=Quillaja saponaria TaxID=32244 RepID=A0AAD7LQE3_QUISA|nr:putative Membrane-associated kinase regulator-like protein [Quillaja saponaria]